MTATLAFVASSSTPAGIRRMSRSDCAATEAFRDGGFQSSPLSPGGRGAGGEGDVTGGESERARSASEERRRDFLASASGSLKSLQPLAICLPGDGLAAEYAMAAGCRVLMLNDSKNLPPFDTACFGSSFLEQTGDEFAARLAEQYSASLIFDVLSATRLSDNVLRVVRAARAGARDVIEASGPAVLVVSESVARPSYVSRYRRQQARRQVKFAPAILSAADWQPVRPRTRRSSAANSSGSIDERTDAAFGMTERATPATDQPIIADPKVCAEHLVRYLAHHGFLQRGVFSPLAHGGRGAGGEGDVTDAELKGARSASEELDSKSLASASGSLGFAAARRPRLPAESAGRRLRQPRRVDLNHAVSDTISVSDRRPRLIGKPRRNDRGPRRVPDSLASA